MAAGFSGCEYRKLMVSVCEHSDHICVPLKHGIFDWSRMLTFQRISWSMDPWVCWKQSWRI